MTVNTEGSLTRVLLQSERSKSPIQYREYTFPSSLNMKKEDFNRPIHALLLEKVYSKNGNISCYFELDDVRLGNAKIILTVHPERRFKPLQSTLDMRQVPIGSHMTITLGQGAHYIVWLRAKINESEN